jgi:hypothetical protein
MVPANHRRNYARDFRVAHDLPKIELDAWKDQRLSGGRTGAIAK